VQIAKPNIKHSNQNKPKYSQTRRGRVISRCWGLGLEGGEEGKEVWMALGIELFFFLELTLKGREISLKPLRKGNSR